MGVSQCRFYLGKQPTPADCDQPESHHPADNSACMYVSGESISEVGRVG